MISFPESDSRSIAPNDPSRFLQAAIRIDQFRAHQSRVLPLIEDAEESRQPTLGDLRVIVQKEKVIAASTCGRSVATVKEPDVGVVSENVDPLHLTQAAGGPGRGIVI